MKFVFFDDFRLGALRDDKVFDISRILDGAAMHTPQEALEALIRRYSELKPKIAEACAGANGIAVAEVRLRQPVPKPTQLACAIRNYKEEGRKPEEGLFLKSPMCLIGHNDTVRLPALQAKVFQHEAELAVVIGKGGSAIPAAEAMNHVFGYTGFNDVSAREAGNSFHMRKSYDTFGPMGPVLVTADEIPDPHNLRVRLWVNDRLRQDYSTGDMATRIDRLIELASTVSSLLPGDVIATGTHHKGLGPMQDGDSVTMEVERVGRLTVRVEDPLHRTWEVD